MNQTGHRHWSTIHPITATRPTNVFQGILQNFWLQRHAPFKCRSRVDWLEVPGYLYVWDILGSLVQYVYVLKHTPIYTSYTRIPFNNILGLQPTWAFPCIQMCSPVNASPPIVSVDPIKAYNESNHGVQPARPTGRIRPANVLYPDLAASYKVQETCREWRRFYERI